MYCRGLRSIWTRRRACVSHATLRVLGGSMLLLIMLGAGQTSAQDGASENQQKKTIRGIVVNSVTHELVARALVSSADRRLAAMTDEQGHFELTVPQPPLAPRANPMEPSQTRRLKCLPRTISEYLWPSGQDS